MNDRTERNYPLPRGTDLRALSERAGPVISLFVPVTAAIPDARQNAVRHARAVSQSLERWKSLGASESEIEKASTQLARFAEDPSSPAAAVRSRAAFWSSDQGVSVFGLPFECSESASIASCARFRPLARAVNRPHAYRVLSLSANRVALFEGDENSLRRLPASGLPTSLEDALGEELSEPTLQTHSGGGQGRVAVYHGQGGAPRGRSEDLEKFHRSIARGLVACLPDDGLPLVLAGDVRHRAEIEKSLPRNVRLASEQVEGNVDHMSEAALHEATWPFVLMNRGASGENRKRAPDGRPVTQLSEIVGASVMGRIETLRVPEVGTIPGRLNRSVARADEGWGDDDLIDHVIAEVVRHGGAVEVLEGQMFSSTDAGLTAVFR